MVTYLRHLRALPAASFAHQHQRLEVLQTVEYLVAVLEDGQCLALGPNRRRVVAIEHERGHLIVGGLCVAFRRERVVICGPKSARDGSTVVVVVTNLYVYV